MTALYGVARRRGSPYTSAVKRALPLILISALSVTSAQAALEVVFVGGRILEVERVEQREGRAVLTLAGGGSIAVAADRIQRVSPVEAPRAAPPAPPAAPVPAPLPEPAAAVTAAPAEPPLMNLEATGGYADLIGQAASRHGVDPELLRCVLLVESSFDPRAVSPKGAMGLAQLMPGTAEELGVENPFDPAESVDAAARLLGRLLRESQGRWVPALAAYNAGRGAVRRYGGVPPYGETVRYIEKILSLYHAAPSR